MREAHLISEYDVSSFSLVEPQIHGGTNSVGQVGGWRLWWSCERRLLPLYDTGSRIPVLVSELELYLNSGVGPILKHYKEYHRTHLISLGCTLQAPKGMSVPPESAIDTTSFPEGKNQTQRSSRRAGPSSRSPDPVIKGPASIRSTHSPVKISSARASRIDYDSSQIPKCKIAKPRERVAPSLHYT